MIVFTCWPVILLMLTARASPQSEWILERRADPESSIRLYVGVRAGSDPDHIEQIASHIASPGHINFRKHLDVRELQQLVKAKQDHVSEVAEWLGLAGVPSSDIQLRGNVFEISTTISKTEKLLQTKYHIYSDDDRTTIRTEGFQVPWVLQEKISFITPTTTFPPLVRQQRSFTVQPSNALHKLADSCGSSDNTSPSCIRQIYNITYTPQPNRTTFAIYATEAASFSSSDLHKFLATYNPPAAAANAAYTVIGSGDPTNGSPGIEGAFETALDTQTAFGLAWPAKGVLYNFGGIFGPNRGQTYDPFVQFLQDLIHNDTVPTVVSFSESMPENQVDTAYAQSLCDMMMQVGMRGVTLLFSSGDNGPQGDQPSGTHKDIFEPEFPASCPWITSVGGTTNLANETAATQTTLTGLISKFSYTASGGGLSNLFSRPAYQNDTVAPYVTNHVPVSYVSKSGFNASGRGIPDVSAFSTAFPVIWNGLTIPIGGTSASTPLWAAVITLLNDYEASKGRPALGFVNPWLYSLKDESGLKDIVTGGNNKGACYLLEGCTLSETDGFDVVEGWDPATGLGSPNFGSLVASLDNLAARRRIHTQ